MKKGLKSYWPLDCYITEGQKLGTFLENKVVYQKYKSHQNSFSLRLILLTEKKSEKDWIDFRLLDDLENQNFYAPLSWTFGLAYSPLNSATL